MTRTYTNRSKMIKTEVFPQAENLSGLTYDEIKKRYDDETNSPVWFNVVATSSGLNGVNGAIIDVWSDNDTEQPYDTFYINERNFTLLSFV